MRDAMRDAANLEMAYNKTWGTLYFNDLHQLLTDGVEKHPTKFTYDADFKETLTMDRKTRLKTSAATKK